MLIKLAPVNSPRVPPEEKIANNNYRMKFYKFKYFLLPITPNLSGKVTLMSCLICKTLASAICNVSLATLFL